ncbi:hypothetical protein F5144DRAFT_79494 [Chaetomium tenue]|uniref:Uncharacterized protein n=1 Tax=Chaetomium tenue TaxID=1854479 RepID=A0ACB7PRR7_9PEZI|nr:hypothetical protein F5144DRAFT_79494 [Chaetomium globosum]
MAYHPCLGVCLRRPVPFLQKVVKQNKADHTAQYNTPHGCRADIPALVLCPWRRCGFVTGVALRSGWSRFLVGEGKPIEPVKRAAWLVGLGSASWRARRAALGPSLALGRALLRRGAVAALQILRHISASFSACSPLTNSIICNATSNGGRHEASTVSPAFVGLARPKSGSQRRTQQTPTSVPVPVPVPSPASVSVPDKLNRLPLAC